MSIQKCKVCGKEYTRREGLYRHMRVAHPKKIECFECDLCSATYKEETSFLWEIPKS